MPSCLQSAQHVQASAADTGLPVQAHLDVFGQSFTTPPGCHITCMYCNSSVFSSRSAVLLLCSVLGSVKPWRCEQALLWLEACSSTTGPPPPSSTCMQVCSTPGKVSRAAGQWWQSAQSKRRPQVICRRLKAPVQTQVNDQSYLRNVQPAPVSYTFYTHTGYFAPATCMVRLRLFLELWHSQTSCRSATVVKIIPAYESALTVCTKWKAQWQPQRMLC